MQASQYLATVQSPPAGIATAYPKGLNYLITESAQVWEFVDPGNTPLALDGMSPSAGNWPLAATFGASLPNTPFVHIGFTSGNPNVAQVDAAARLICCVANKYGIILDTQHVITAFDIDDTRAGLTALPAQLLPLAIACPQPQNISASIAECCETVQQHTSQIATLTAQIATIQTFIAPLPGQISAIALQIPGILSRLTALEAQQNALTQQVTAAYAAYTATLQRLTRAEACLSKIPACNDPCVTCNFSHEFVGNTPVTPGVAQNIPANIKIEDACGFVTSLAFWQGSFTRDVCVTGEVVLDAGEWCEGKKAEVWAVSPCLPGGRALVASYTAPSTGGQPMVTLAIQPVGINGGTLTSACTLHFEILIDDVTPSNPNKFIKYAAVRSC
jgi:hypothetical protein